MSWTNQRLLTAAAVILTAHFIAIFTLHTRQPILARIAVTGSPRLYFAPAAKSPPPNEIDGLEDPLAFASANPRGFSGSAWMTHPKMDYAATNSIARPRFLAFARTPVDVAPAAAPAPPNAPLPFLKLNLPKPPRQSTLTIQGSLSARPIRSALPVLPIQVASEILSNTIVQLGVLPDGYPFSARIITGSGSRAADLAALQIANQIRFAPNRATPALQWGDLTFQWFTAAPSTNLPALK